ncbi:hypothetical protein GY45DRAFT_721546 [Cubamyces sp. BRFM 1775]|nr:hypothetical protein GY45DRAFT_721546 [Cubamyces sp. BRFM 1775]
MLQATLFPWLPSGVLTSSRAGRFALSRDILSAHAAGSDDRSQLLSVPGTFPLVISPFMAGSVSLRLKTVSTCDV